MKPNGPYILVQINKEEQTEKRETFYGSLKPYLGMQLIDNESGSGCIVNATEPGSPAELAGFNNGDILLQLNGLDTNNVSDFINALLTFKPNDEVTILYLSRFNPNQPFSKKVTLGSFDFKLLNNTVQLDMRFNLQYGNILAIGEEAQSVLPEMAIGDLLIFHHTVEYRPRTEGDRFYNDWHLIDTLPDGNEIRLVRVHSEVFGVLKQDEDGTYIVPHKDWIFCHSQIQPASFQLKNGIWLPVQWKMDMEAMAAKLEELAEYFQSVGSSTVMSQKTTEENYRRKEEIQKKMEEINRERAELAKIMNQKELLQSRIVFVSPKTCEELQQPLQPGDMVVMDKYSLYPLDLGGIQYALARVDMLEYAISKSHN